MMYLFDALRRFELDLRGFDCVDLERVLGLFVLYPAVTWDVR